MNDEEAVRAVLGIGKFTISNIYRAVKKVIDDKNRKLSKPIFNASEVLNENLSENKEAIKALEKEYKVKLDPSKTVLYGKCNGCI